MYIWYERIYKMNLLCKHNTQEHASSTPLHRGSSSVSIQSDRVTLLPMHTSRTQAAPPCAVWETPPKRAPSTKRVGAALKWWSRGRGRASRIPARGLPSAPCSGVCSRCFTRGRQRRRLLQRRKAPAASCATSAAGRVAGACQEKPRLGGSWHHPRWAQCRAHRRQPARRRR